MIDWLEATLLGVIQGATEFLPVSSSGHLVIGQHLFGLPQPALLFDIALHVATLFAVVWYYRRDILELLRESGSGLGGLLEGRAWSEIQSTYPAFRLAWLIVIGTVPTALIGIGFEDWFEGLFGSLRTVGFMLILTGLILLLSRISGSGNKDISGMGVIDALLVGFVQGLAILPGISRSGSTIVAALLLGVERETAARYSFLLSVPSIIGALVLKLGDAGDGVGPTATALGFLAALATGYFCLVFLVRVVKRGKLTWFAPYCIGVGLLTLALARGL